MTFRIPPDGTGFSPLQSRVDPEDLAILLDGIARTGVLSGCAVATTAAANGSVTVAVGVTFSGGARRTSNAATLAVTANATGNPRRDLVVSPAAGGTPTVLAGTAAANPSLPVPAAGDIALATVFVPSGHTATSTIAASQVDDRRVDLQPQPFMVQTIMAAAAGTSAIITFPPCPLVEFDVNVTGYASGGIVGIRFGTTTTPEATARYWHRNHPDPATAGAVWGTSAQAASATGLTLASSSITLGRITKGTVANAPGMQAHPAQWSTTNSSNAPATAAIGDFGSGEYISTTAGQIISAQLWTSGGNLNAGTSLTIRGLAG